MSFRSQGGARSLSGGISVWRGVSVQGGLSLGGLCCGMGDLCLGRGLCHGDPPPPPYGNVRAVRILLECILVSFYYFFLEFCLNHGYILFTQINHGRFEHTTELRAQSHNLRTEQTGLCEREVSVCTICCRVRRVRVSAQGAVCSAVGVRSERCLPRGVSAWRGCIVSQHVLGLTPLGQNS